MPSPKCNIIIDKQHTSVYLKTELLQSVLEKHEMDKISTNNFPEEEEEDGELSNTELSHLICEANSES